jgi:hypothetical protein
MKNIFYIFLLSFVLLNCQNSLHNARNEAINDKYGLSSKLSKNPHFLKYYQIMANLGGEFKNKTENLSDDDLKKLEGVVFANNKRLKYTPAVSDTLGRLKKAMQFADSISQKIDSLATSTEGIKKLEDMQDSLRSLVTKIYNATINETYSIFFLTTSDYNKKLIEAENEVLKVFETMPELLKQDINSIYNKNGAELVLEAIKQINQNNINDKCIDLYNSNLNARIASFFGGFQFNKIFFDNSNGNKQKLSKNRESLYVSIIHDCYKYKICLKK